MITVENLAYSYGRKTPDVLQDINLVLRDGCVYGLLGPNGAGKSTLLYLIAGMLTPKAGCVLLDDNNTRRRLPSTLSDIFIVPEEFDLPDISLQAYVNLNSKYYPNFSMEDLQRHLKTFGMESNPKLGSMSMGQKKKVFMAFALACNTKVILMDEPTNGLDIPGKSAFRRFIASGMTDERIILISTHQVRDVDNILDHIVMMNSTRIIYNAAVDEIMEKLAFVNTVDSDIIEKSLFSVPGIGGTGVILPNDGSFNTKIDLELLFQYGLENPQSLTCQLSDYE